MSVGVFAAAAYGGAPEATEKFFDKSTSNSPIPQIAQKLLLKV